MIVLDMILRSAIEPALRRLPLAMSSRKARVLLLAIGAQESRFKFRYQVTDQPGVKGPARGFWQFEKAGGVRGVMTHPKTEELAQHLCNYAHVPFDEKAIWQCLESDDVLAAGFARLLLWADPEPLPLEDHEAAWQYYLRNWRPGKPHRETWDEFHREALAQVLL